MAKNKPVNVAVIGCGFMGLTHIKAYRKLRGARIAAICDAFRLPKDGDFSNIHGNIGDDQAVKLDMSQVKAFTDYRQAIDDPEIDLIDICVHTGLHPEIAVAALQAGKHVVCEKPMCRDSQAGRQMVDAEAASKAYLLPAMCIRFWPEYAYVRKAIREGTFGKCYAARFRRVAEPPGWSQNIFLDGAKSGGAILDLHIHDADFVQFCFGRPKAVYAAGYTKISGAIDHVVANYTVEGGAIVQAEGAWAMAPGFGFNMAYTVNFEDATVDYDLARGADALRLYVKGQAPQTVRCEGGDGYIGELQYMVDCIQQGQAPELVTGKDGLSAVEICEAELKSIQTGKIVPLA